MSETERAVALVGELIRHGVQDVVLAPGSRSAPLAVALAAAENQRLLRLHVRIDERSAGFLALGIALRSNRTVPLLTTSGSAPAHLLPAMLEASYAGVPLLALTADRPAHLHGIGANQTVDQQRMYGSAARAFFDLDEHADVRSAIAAAVAAATLPTDPGPVQVNIAFESPYVPEPDIRFGDISLYEVVEPNLAAVPKISELLGKVPARGVVVIGHPAPAVRSNTTAALALAAAHGWPVIAEPTGNALHAALAHAPLLLRSVAFSDDHLPDLVVVVGGIGLDRNVLRMVSRAARVLTVDPRPSGRRSDPTRTTDVFAAEVPLPDAAPIVDRSWLAAWQAASSLAATAVAESLASAPLTGALVARTLAGSLLPLDQLLVAASWSVRHVFSFAERREDPPWMFGNRGTSGIDGLISTAWGAALRHPGRTYALMGDLAFLHDHNGLLSAPGEPVPDLVIVVCDNDGGGIFSSLEQRDADGFERVFATPHGRDLANIARAAGASVATVDDLDGLVSALDDARSSSRVRVVVARTAARTDEADLLRHIEGEVAAALTATP